MQTPFEKEFIPRKWSDIKGNKKIVEALKTLVKGEKSGTRMPHILLIGPPGIGKTSTINVIRHELGLIGESVFREINASVGARMDDIRGGIHDFYTILPIQTTNRNRRKMLVLEEIDNMPKTSQQGFRRDMEVHVSRVLIAATANEDKIIGALHDRMSVYYWLPPTPDDILERLEEICVIKKMDVSPKILRDMANRSGSFRKAVQNLGVLYAGGQWEVENFDETVKMVAEFLRIATGGDIKSAGKFVVDECVKLGVTERIFLHRVADEVITASLAGGNVLPIKWIRILIRILADADFRIVTGAHPKITLMWVINELQKAYRRDKKK